MPSPFELIQTRWRTPDPQILARIEGEEWSAHNIPLSEGSSTIKDPNQLLIGEEPRTLAIKRNLDIFLDPRSGSSPGYKGRLIDLGCLEGGVSFEMARDGFDVLGVEGRRANYDKCQLIEDYYQLPNLRFLHLDVKELSPRSHGLFDAVVCCGLLYHLDDPFAFLHKLSSVTHEKSVIFLDTHVAPSAQILDHCVFRDSLSDFEELLHEGRVYPGRWYAEYPQAGYSHNPWASVSNYRSFWPTQAALIAALDDAGFRFVYELHGSRPVREEADLKLRYSRVYLIALKQEYFRERLF